MGHQSEQTHNGLTLSGQARIAKLLSGSPNHQARTTRPEIHLARLKWRLCLKDLPQGLGICDPFVVNSHRSILAAKPRLAV